MYLKVLIKKIDYGVSYHVIVRVKAVGLLTVSSRLQIMPTKTILAGYCGHGVHKLLIGNYLSDLAITGDRGPRCVYRLKEALHRETYLC